MQVSSVCLITYDLAVFIFCEYNSQPIKQQVLKNVALSSSCARHVFHKHCVDPWLLDHRTCPMCKMNILKALGIPVSFFAF